MSTDTRSRVVPPSLGLSGLLLLTIVLTVSGLSGLRGHEGITSKYTYNEHVFPILQARCGGCHVAGGVAPMSLMTYRDTYPWAQSIKEEIVHLRMPPWHVEDGFGAFRQAESLSAREVDILIEWTSGGTPEGDPAKKPPPVALDRDWTLGAPDLLLEMPAEHVLDEATSEAVVDVALPTGLTVDTWVRAVDLRPGTPPMVRGAVIYLEPKGGATPLATWLPGHAPIEVTPDAAFRIPAGATLRLRIHYRKTWTYDGQRMADRSSVGLYFLASAARPIQSMVMGPATREAQAPPGVPGTFVYAVGRAVNLVALFPERSPAGAVLQVEAVRRDGTRERLLRLVRDRRAWPRRFWLERPVQLPAGSRLEVAVQPATSGEMAGSSPADQADPPAVTLWLDVVAAPAGVQGRAPSDR